MRPHGAPPFGVELRDEGLIVHCGACTDGDAVSHRDRRATFSHGDAVLKIDDQALTLGQNHLPAQLTASGKTWPITLEVVVPYRVSVSLDRLATAEPSFEVIFEVTDDVRSIEVDEHPFTPKNGRVTVVVAVAAATRNEQRTLEKKVDFTVAVGNGERRGSVAVTVPYLALSLSLPSRASIVIGDEPIEIAGRASPFAAIRIGEGEPIAIADKEGVFHGVTKLAVGTKATLVATAAGYAPRKLEIAPEHDESPAAAWKTLRARVTTPFATIAAAPDSHLGEWVDVEIEVSDTTSDDGRAIAMGGARCTTSEARPRCPSTIVLLPSHTPANKGETIEVIGVVVRDVSIEQGIENGIEPGKGTATMIDAAIVQKR